MLTINPHINFNSNAEEVFTFYKSVFGGEFANVTRYKYIVNPGFEVPEEEKEKIMHIALPIGPTMLMGNDVPQFMGKTNERENRSKIMISVDSREEADRLFNQLSVEGEKEYPMGESPWGSYFGSFRDKYGIEWMIDCSKNS